MDNKIGLFFGSFNPIHIGHIIIANVMVESTDLDQVWFVVTPQNPLKKNKNLLHEFDRIEMVEAAVDDNHKLKVSDAEFRLPRPSYTINTLTYLQEKHPKHSFVLLIGEDNLSSFHKWKNYKDILKSFQLYVYPRVGGSGNALQDEKNIRYVEAPVLNISATFIRNCVKNGVSIRYLVPERVMQIIEAKGYYRN